MPEMPEMPKKYYVVVLRHTMYGDTPLSGEILNEVRAKGFRDGAELMHDMRGDNPYEKIVLVEHDFDESPY